MTGAFSLQEFFAQFHFLRPAFFLCLIPLVWVSYLMWRNKNQTKDWQAYIAPEFLPFLMEQKFQPVKRSIFSVFLIANLITLVALAGPAWTKRPSPVEKNQQALVIVLDLSISMLSQDLKPSRLARAKLKMIDLLRERDDGQTALVVYAGDAHLVTPLSDDKNTLLNLLPSLSPQIMPTQGSNTEAAIKMAVQLLKNAGFAKGDILLLTDGVVPEAFQDIHAQISNSGFRLSILGVGISAPTPITNERGVYLRDAQGAIVTTQLNAVELKSLASQVNGIYTTLTADDADIQLIAGEIKGDEFFTPEKKSSSKNQREFDQWFDQGYWLIFLILPLVLISFRKGFLPILLVGFCISFTPNHSEAAGLENAFQTLDQQGQQKFNAGDAKAAAERFQNPEWRAAAEYKAGNYQAAAKDYAELKTATADYNRGNALAKLGQLDNALNAYDEALKKEPNLTDAKKNRDLVKSLLDQKKQNDQKNQERKDKDKKDSDQKENDQQNKNQSEQNSSSDQQKDKQQKENQEKQQDQNQQGKQESSKNSAQQQGANSSNANTQQGQQSSVSSQKGQSASDSMSASSKSNQNAEENRIASSSQSKSSSTTAAQYQQATSSERNKKMDKADPYEAKMTTEEKEKLQQWLRQVPDDPGGLLREKFKWQAIHNQENDKASSNDQKNSQQRW